MKKYVIAAAFMVMAAQAKAVPTFQVDPVNAFGPGYPAPFTADFISGTSSSLVTPTGATTAHGTGYVDYSTFSLNGSNILAGVSGLNSQYQIFAVVDYDLALDSGTLFAPDSTYSFTNLHMTFYADPSIGTPTTFTAATNAGAAPVVGLGAGSVIIANADLVTGVADINAQGGVGVNATNSFALTAAGQSLFDLPVPFYDMQFIESNNTSSGNFRDPGGNFFVTNQVSSGADFAVVPEPSALALVGLGLLSLVLARRRV